MKSSILRFGSMTILASLALVCLAQVMSVALANGNSSQESLTPFEPPFLLTGPGFLPSGPRAQDDGGPPALPGLRRSGRAAARGRSALSNADASSIFLEAPTYNSGGEYAYSIAVADVNGDGHPDLLVANECVSSGNCANGGVGVLLGNGDGTCQAPVSYSNGGAYAESSAVADVNGDGHPDLLVANQCVSSGNCSNGGVGVLLGNGDGTFQAAVSYNSGGYAALSIAVA